MAKKIIKNLERNRTFLRLFSGESATRYLIAKYPDALYDQCSPRIEVEVVEPPAQLTYSQMAGATCFSLHPSLKWKASR